MTLELLEYKRDHTKLTEITAVSWLLCHYQLQSNNTRIFCLVNDFRRYTEYYKTGKEMYGYVAEMKPGFWNSRHSKKLNHLKIVQKIGTICSNCLTTMYSNVYFCNFIENQFFHFFGSNL